MTPEIRFFGDGMLAAGYLIAALFFLRFWRDSHDRLFAFFAAAFGLLMVQRTLLALLRSMNDETSWIYLIRLLAYVLILIAIYDKNRSTRGDATGTSQRR
jgi:membrane-associated PAP2 superfamily phosphatase